MVTTKSLSLKARALRYLSMREHSRLELAKKLAHYAQEGDDIDALLDSLEASQWLSETRFITSFVNRRAARFGNNRILFELNNHGIQADALSDLKTNLMQDEIARACTVWRKKFGQQTDDSNDATQRAKQMRFLQQRGFSHQAIQSAMKRCTGNDVDEID